MLLAIGVGNSNTSVGLFDRDKKLCFLASLDTDIFFTFLKLHRKHKNKTETCQRK